MIERFCGYGLFNYIVPFIKNDCPVAIKIESSYFIGMIVSCSEYSRKLFLSSQGLKVISNLLDLPYNNNSECVNLGIDSLLILLESQDFSSF